MNGMGRSEGLVLQKTNEFIRETIEKRRALIAEAEELGIEVAPEMKR